MFLLSPSTNINAPSRQLECVWHILILFYIILVVTDFNLLSSDYKILIYLRKWKTYIISKLYLINTY